MLKKPGLYLLIIVIFLALFALRLDTPPSVVDHSAPDSVFAATRAYKYLEVICRAPHSTGTMENKRVREYLVSQCQQWGLETKVQQTTAVTRFEDRIRAANVYNVIARLKGKNGKGKALMVLSHYDTQPNTPGAGDDGAGVAAMLETIHILTSAKIPLENDVIFLFTDAEESGLQGAEGFAQDSVMMNEIGLVLNFEGRGNAGVSSLFEVNPENGWVVKNYIKGAAHPIGNSLGYEIYKTLPNDTDYTIFREAGITGLNHAFADGFVNYHSPNDKPENLDLRSLQQHGDNLLSLVKYFGNISLEQTKAPDISFFNVIGEWMVSYPASWNLGLTVLCCLLYIAFVIIGFKRKLMTIKGFVVGFFAFAGFIIVAIAVSVLMIKGIEATYPLYKHFYGSNAYNVKAYFFAFTMMTIALYAMSYRWLLARFSEASLLGGMFLLLVKFVVLMYWSMPTAIFILLFPVAFSLTGNILISSGVLGDKTTASTRGLIQIAFLLPSILWLVPALSNMFVIFGLALPVAAVILILGLLLGLLLPVFSLAFDHQYRVVLFGALAGWVGALITAQLYSGYTPERPLQSNVYYQYRVDENKAYWVSEFTETDEWNKQFFPQSKVEKGQLINEAPLIPLQAPEAVLMKDTIQNDMRLLSIHFRSRRNGITLRIEIDEKNPGYHAIVNGPAGGSSQQVHSKDELLVISYVGLDSAGVNILFETKPGKPFELTLHDRTMGLPVIEGMANYPGHIIPGTGWRANTTQVMKKFAF